MQKEFVKPNYDGEKPSKSMKTVNDENDFLISSEFEEETIVSEADQVRQMYTDAYADDYEGETIIANLCTIYVSSKTKTSKSGNEYQSNMCITKLFIDEDETKIAFFDEMFKDYNETKNQIRVKNNHPIAEIVRGLTGNTTHNTFLLDLDKFQDKLKSLDQLKVKIYSYDENGYERYSFKLLAYSEK